MIRLQPTVVSLTMSEVKDLETRRRYRRYLQREENPTSEETVQRKSSLALEPKEPRRTLGSSQNRESSSSPNSAIIDPLPSSPLERIVNEHAEDEESTPSAPRQGMGLALAKPEHRISLDSLDFPSSTGRYLSARPRRPRLLQGSSDSDRPTDSVNPLASPFEQCLSPQMAREPEATMVSETTASTRRHPTVSMPSLPPPFSQNSRRVSTESTWSRTLAIRTRESLGSEASPSNPARQRRQSSCRDSVELQNDGQPGPSNPNSPQKSVKAATRLFQLCPKRGNTPSDSHEGPLARDCLSPDRTMLPTQGRPASLARDLTTTPQHRIQVYDDVLSPTRQPQTPEQLPESRHQSRIPGSYTAPVSRFRSSQTPSHTPVTARRLHHSRQPSPVGMRTPGFEGLYGGQENEDDVALFEEASQGREQESPNLSPRSAG